MKLNMQAYQTMLQASLCLQYNGRHMDQQEQNYGTNGKVERRTRARRKAFGGAPVGDCQGGGWGKVEKIRKDNTTNRTIWSAGSSPEDRINTRIPCYVLADGTRVLAQRGTTKRDRIFRRRWAQRRGRRIAGFMARFGQKKGIDVKGLVARANNPIPFIRAPAEETPQMGTKQPYCQTLCAVIIRCRPEGKAGRATQSGLARACGGATTRLCHGWHYRLSRRSYWISGNQAERRAGSNPGAIHRQRVAALRTHIYRRTITSNCFASGGLSSLKTPYSDLNILEF